MLHQSKAANRRETAPVPLSAGMEAVAIFSYVFKDAYTAATDIIELGAIPATARVTGCTVIGEGLGVVTADIGIIDGEPGDGRDETRDLTAELLFDDVDVNDNEASAAMLTCLGIAVSQAHRGLGAKLSGDVAAGAAKKLTLVLRYTY